MSDSEIGGEPAISTSGVVMIFLGGFFVRGFLEAMFPRSWCQVNFSAFWKELGGLLISREILALNGSLLPYQPLYYIMCIKGEGPKCRES